MAFPRDVSKLVDGGENPNGMISQTPNGTIRDGMGCDGSQPRYNMADGPRWNRDPAPELPRSFVSVEPPVASIPLDRIMIASHTRRKPR
jgi:hypothetical protein